MTEPTCPMCEAPVPPKIGGRGNPRKYCSEPCRREAGLAAAAARYVRKRTTPDNTVCPACGGAVPARGQQGGPPKKYCSKRCTDTAADRKRHQSVPRSVCFKCRTAEVPEGSRVCSSCRLDSALRYRMRTKYASDETWYKATFAAQKSRCAVCGTADPKSKRKMLVVDHDHVTGQLRGLLCAPCNMGIGQLGDDPDVLAAAAKYIRKHRQLRLVQ